MKLDLEDRDAVIILHEDGSFDIYVPNEEDGADVPDHTLCASLVALLIQRWRDDPELFQATVEEYLGDSEDADDPPDEPDRMN